MSMLEAALAWAGRGFRVFPLRAGTKDQPLWEGWTEYATCDPEQIKRWWTDPTGMAVLDHNIGVLTTGMIVVDADPKNGGMESAEKLGLGFDTLTVKTPSSGLHYYYNGPDSAPSVGRIAPGIDIRSHNSYVLAPGSRRADGAYSLEFDAPLADVPDSIRFGLRAPQERQQAAGPERVDEDRPDAIEMAALLLRRMPPAIEGQGGDQHTYEVACKVRDLGVSELTCWFLMLDEFNPRCEPPWDADELLVKVENAYSYATGEAGGKHPALQLDGIALPEPIAAAEPELPKVRFGNAVDQMHIPPRDWRCGRILLRQLVTIIAAPGAASKSTIALTLAAHKALGRDFLGLPTKKGKSVVYNSEDDILEQSRRLNAICVHFGFDFNEVRDEIFLIDSSMINLKLTENSPPVINGDHVNFLIDACSPPDCDLLVLDPFVSLLSASEDDNQAMDYVMSVLKIVAREANVAALIVDHTKKPGQQSQAGDMMSGRGASSKPYAARVYLTLQTMTKEECAQHGVPEAERHKFVRMDDAKMNLTLANGKPLWLKKHGVKLWNGDEVGVVGAIDMQETPNFLRQQMAETFLVEMTQKGLATIPITQAVALLQNTDPLYGELTPQLVQNRIKTLLASGAEVNGNRISIQYTGRSPIVVLS